MKSYIILENGQKFIGESVYDFKDTVCEIVFNTSMVGYLEILTEPSYAGQGIVMTYPLIGNYGVIEEDSESDKIWVSAFITHQFARQGSNFRSKSNILEYLHEKNIPAVFGIDTRMLTRILRKNGTMKSLITTKDYSIEEAQDKINEYKEGNLIELVSKKGEKTVGEGNTRIALMDFGCKENIINTLVDRDCTVTIFPSDTKAEKILEGNFDGVVLSNGPGDPKDFKEIIENIKKIYNSNMPVLGLCLGHQLMALAAGLHTYKLKYGHRGANHPVRDLETGKVYITSQNHGYVVDSNVDEKIAKVSYLNVNDDTIEGLNYVGKNINTVQFYPEVCDGPQDTSFLFDNFLNSLKK